ncbi:MAG: response regulator [Pyrinomonadaceae bacterium]
MSAATQRTVLVVEDDASTRDFFCSLFRQHAYTVVEAHNGKEGILAASRAHPDLIVMDLAMPEMDGIETVRRIKQVPKLADIPVFAVSAYGVAAVKADAIAAGCREVFDKPVDIDLFLTRIEEVLRAESSPRTPPKEQRTHLFPRSVERVQTAIPIDWGVTEACPHIGTITSLSVKGCLVQTDHTEPLYDKPIFVQFKLPQRTWVSVRGEVLYYLRGSGFGLGFKEMSDESKALIALLVDQRRQRKLTSQEL